MNLFALLLLFTVSATPAHADYLECKNDKERSTEVGFYNHWGKIVFQLSAPYKDEYLYVLGHCYSENEVGLPYDCEPESTIGSDQVDVNLVRGENDQAVAEIILKFDDGSTNREMIPCSHIARPE